jgi:hypothetical protein
MRRTRVGMARQPGRFQIRRQLRRALVDLEGVEHRPVLTQVPAGTFDVAADESTLKMRKPRLPLTQSVGKRERSGDIVE